MTLVGVFSFAVSGQCNVEINATENLCSSDSITITNPLLTDVNTFNFGGAPPDVTSGTLTVYAVGDIDNSYEEWDIFNENGTIIGSVGGSGAPCTVQMVTIPITASDLINWSANGTITFQAIDVSGVDINTDLCGDDSIQMVLEVCTSLDCNGSEISLEASGTGSYSVVLDENFESGYGPGLTAPVSGDLSNPCEPSVDGGTYLWMGNGVLSPRILTTLPLDVSCGGEVCFYLDFAIQGENPPCEGIDLANEGVYLEYSTDNGTTWNSIEYYGPAGVGNNTDNGGNDPMMTTWNQYCAAIPQSAFSNSTMFQWAQYGASGIDNDQWGIDNIEIIAYDYCDPYSYDWSHIVGSNDPNTDTDTLYATYTYYVTYSNAYESCVDSVTIEIPDGIIVDAGIDTVICDGSGSVTIGGSPSASGGTSGVFNYAWTPTTGLSNPGISNPVASPSVSTLYFLTVTDGNNCSNTDQVWVHVGNSPVVNVGADQVVCQGDTTVITANGADSYFWSPATGLNSTTSATVYAYPSSSVNYIVTGTDSIGCTGSDDITITVEPTPVVDAGADIEICAGESVTLTGSGSPGLTFSWDHGVIDGVSFVPASSDFYMLTGTSANGCTDNDQLMITVHPNPVIIAQDTTVCEGDTVGLTVSGADNYTWSPGTFLNQTNGANVISIPSNNIIYTIVGSDVNGCVDSVTLQMTVNPSPQPIINGQSHFCTGTYSTLFTSIPYNSYVWSNGSFNPGIDVVESDNPISVEVVNAYGCSAVSDEFVVIEDTVIIHELTVEICQGDSALIHGTWENAAGVYSDTLPSSTSCDSISNVTLNIHAPPNVNAGIDVSICFGDSVIFFGSGAPILSWDNGVQNGSYLLPSLGNNTYTLTGTSEYGCSNTDDRIILVNGLPNVEAGPDLEVCDGEQVVLSGSGATSYSWTNGVQNNDPFTPSVGTVLYSVTGTDMNGCQNNDSVQVQVFALPSVDAGPDISICEGEQVTLTASGANAYLWDNGVTDGVPFTPISDTVYTVTGTDQNGCTATDQVSILIVQAPIALFVPDTLYGCTPFTVNFENLSLGNLHQCVWTIGADNYTNDCSDLSYLFNQPGTYMMSLEVFNTEGCSDQYVLSSPISVSSPPIVSFWPSTTTLTTLDTEVQFNNTSMDVDSYFWNFGDGSSVISNVNPSHIFPDTEENIYAVTLVGTTFEGCADTSIVYIHIYEELIYYVPNSFTPDNDGFNDTFLPVFTSGFDPDDFTLYIFNRWGDIVFESHDASQSWNGKYGKNGKLAPDGTYTWKVIYKISGRDKHEVATGHVNLLR